MKYLLLSIALIWGSSASACDMCGCSSSNQFLGILPNQQWHFVGLQYQYSGLSGSYPSAYSSRPREHATNTYHTLQLWGRYNVGKHYQVFAFVPYMVNDHQQDGGNATVNGIGDITLLVNRVLLNTTTSKWTQLLYGGAGIKLPTGKRDGMSMTDKSGLPNMQPGTGSTDFMVSTNYTLRRDKYGANIEANYVLTTPNKDNYKYGNKVSTGASGFYTTKAGNITLQPQVGMRYEYSLHDYDNYRRKWLNEQSGGYLCFATVGLQAYYRKVGARAVWQVPVSQYYNAGNATASQKAEAGIFLLF
jgi:hypothetical protein